MKHLKQLREQINTYLKDIDPANKFCTTMTSKFLPLAYKLEKKKTKQNKTKQNKKTKNNCTEHAFELKTCKKQKCYIMGPDLSRRQI